MKPIDAGRDEILINKFSTLQILVIGDLMVDKYVWGNGIRLSTEAAVPVIKVTREDYSLGGAANIAFHLANLGSKVFLCGPVGYDDAAHNLRSQVVKAGIDVGGVFPSSHRPTTQKIRIMSTEHRQLLSRFDYETDAQLATDEQATILRLISTYANDIDIMILADYGRGVFKSKDFIAQISAISKDTKLKSLVQSRSENMDIFCWADYMIVNSRHAKSYIYRRTKTYESRLDWIGEHFQKYVPVKQLVVCDHGEQQIALFIDQKEVFRCSESDADVRDQTGLSDITIAIISLAVGAGSSPEEAITLAYRGTQLAGQQVGTGVVSKADLLA